MVLHIRNGPGGKSLFVNDVATGFPRTSRWSLTGVCEKQWFTGSNDNYAPPVNPARLEACTLKFLWILDFDFGSFENVSLDMASGQTRGILSRWQ